MKGNLRASIDYCNPAPVRARRKVPFGSMLLRLAITRRRRRAAAGAVVSLPYVLAFSNYRVVCQLLVEGIT